MSGADVVDLLLSTIGVGVLLAPLVLLTVGGAVGLIDASSSNCARSPRGSSPSA